MKPLLYTERRKALIARAIRSRKFECGCRARFYRLTDTVGVKFYRTQQELRNAIRRNRVAYDVGIAPRHGTTVITEKVGGRIRYGYLVEVVPVLTVDDSEFSILENAVGELGFSTIDISLNHNVGMLHGNPVIYDFDDLTLSDD